jgi:SAM-dependent methyltransferase
MDVAIDYAKFADLYDDIVRFEEDIPFFLEECGKVDGSVLELTAGTGRLSLPLAEAGVPLTCVDCSEEMLAILRKRLAERRLHATVVRQDVRDLDLRSRFPLALMPFHSFAELVTDGDRRRAIGSIRRCVSPRGRFVCTLHNPDVRLRSISSSLTTVGRFQAARGGEVVLRTRLSFDEASGIVEGVQIFDEIDAEGAKRGERIVPVSFALLGVEAFEALARAGGFETEALYGDYGRSPFDPEESPYMIWSLRASGG